MINTARSSIPKTHTPPAPDWTPPSLSVYPQNWKLIREFYQGQDGAHRSRLFDLTAEIGEKKNLASQKPELVSEF